MEISLLADNPQESKVIARWYYDEWASIAPDMTIGQIQEKVAKAINRDQVPLIVLAHQNNELVGVAELKFRENKNHPEYEHWLDGLFVTPDYRGQGISNLLIKKSKSMPFVWALNAYICSAKSIMLHFIRSMASMFFTRPIIAKSKWL